MTIELSQALLAEIENSIGEKPKQTRWTDERKQVLWALRSKGYTASK